MASKKAKTARPTRTETRAAFKAQAPSDKKRGAQKTPIAISALDFANERKAYSNFDSEVGNWIPSENLFGQKFWIVRAWSFEGDFGSKVGFEVKFDPTSEDTALFSLTWTEERETYVKAYRSLRRKHSSVEIGPYTMIEVPSKNEQNDYRKLAPWSESLAAEYAQRASTPSKRGRKASKSGSLRTQAAKIDKVKQLRAKKPGSKTTPPDSGEVSF